MQFWIKILFVLLLWTYPYIVEARSLQCLNFLSPKTLNVAEQNKVQMRVSNNQFFIARNLSHYENLLTSPQIPKFLDFIRALSRNEIYLDAGAGEARVQSELLRRSDELQLADIQHLAVAVKKPGLSEDFKRQRPEVQTELDRVLARHHNQFKYIEGDLIENLAQSSRSDLFFYRNKVSLITDIYGPFSYTTNIEVLLKTYANLLKVNGSALIHFYEPGLGFGKTKANGQISSRKYLGLNLELIPQLTEGRLEVVKFDQQHEGVWPQANLSILWIRKVSDTPLLKPHLSLKLTHIYDEAPPIRTYEIITTE